MAPQFDRAPRDLLRAAGCTFVRQGRGSHEIWRSPLTKRNFAVPVGILSRHTANAILRQAGLPKAFRAAAARTDAFGTCLGYAYEARSARTPRAVNINSCLPDPASRNKLSTVKPMVFPARPHVFHWSKTRCAIGRCPG
jgi:predicted RNA binding protein YcfA (HicA-like mRNA interferase family)